MDGQGRGPCFTGSVKVSPSVSYSIRRLLLFAGTLVLCAALLPGVSPILILAAAAVISGVLSYFLLAGAREQMAASVAGRMTKLNSRLEAGAATEDAALDEAEERVRRERARTRSETRADTRADTTGE